MPMVARLLKKACCEGRQRRWRRRCEPLNEHEVQSLTPSGIAETAGNREKANLSLQAPLEDVAQSIRWRSTRLSDRATATS